MKRVTIMVMILNDDDDDVTVVTIVVMDVFNVKYGIVCENN